MRQSLRIFWLSDVTKEMDREARGSERVGAKAIDSSEKNR